LRELVRVRAILVLAGIDELVMEGGASQKIYIYPKPLLSPLFNELLSIFSYGDAIADICHDNKKGYYRSLYNS
jgi:hypothetical protein